MGVKKKPSSEMVKTILLTAFFAVSVHAKNCGVCTDCLTIGGNDPWATGPWIGEWAYNGPCQDPADGSCSYVNVNDNTEHCFCLIPDNGEVNFQDCPPIFEPLIRPTPPPRPGRIVRDEEDRNRAMMWVDCPWGQGGNTDCPGHHVPDPFGQGPWVCCPDDIHCAFNFEQCP